MKKVILFFLFMLSLTLAAEGEKADASVKLNSVGDFYKLILEESIKICKDENCEILIKKTTRDVMIGEKCHEFCPLDIKKCQNKYPGFISWIEKNFNSDERVYHAYLRMSASSPCSYLLDGPSRELFYKPRTGEVLIVGGDNENCSRDADKKKPKKAK